MPLSEREQRMLKDLEQQLQSDDPRFASSLEASPVGGSFNVRNLILGLLVAVVGVGVLILGIYQQWIILGIAGFIIMGGGVYFATTGAGSSPKTNGNDGNGGSGGSGGSGPRSSAPSPSGGAFMSNLEQKWEERRRQ